VKFLGIDLGWSSGASGLCCLEWREGKLCLLDLRREDAIASILAWIDRWIPTSESGMIAVDAPTLIPNLTGMRLPDRLTHQHFGRYHAGCYPANLGRPFATRTVEFGLSLQARGFDHAPTIVPKQLGRHQIEVFPHPAIVQLFRLDRILKYKKGNLAERRAELAKLRHYILEDLPVLEPHLSLQNLPEIPLKGTDLKALEDQLDSVICAYVAAHWWYWGLEQNWVLGDRSEGYIIVPAPLENRRVKTVPT
jgi:predicted RNase H-like nuclease